MLNIRTIVVCVYCGSALPSAVRKERTIKMEEGAICSPLCKIRGRLVVPNDQGCWLFMRPAFTWNYRSYSIKGVLYEWHFDAPKAPEVIPMSCSIKNCANPEHMVAYGRARIRRVI